MNSRKGGEETFVWVERFPSLEKSHDVRRLFVGA